jgi:hypothetical protein
MIGIWFSFAPDAKCLLESVICFRKTFPDNKICISDDPHNPISEEIKKLIKPDYYELRNWSSKSNLNGWECIKGILNLQIKLQDLFPGYPGAIKIDCDTLVGDSSWIDLEKPISGFDLGTECLFAGMARYLRKDVPQIILDELSTRWQWDIARVPEDQGISVYCLKLFGKECNSIKWFDGARSYSYTDDSKNKKFAKVITFGNRNEIKDHSPDDKRRIAGEAMEIYRKLHFS